MSPIAVVTAELPDTNLLRRYVVFAANEAGAAVSPATWYATKAAADLQHTRIARELMTLTKWRGGDPA